MRYKILLPSHPLNIRQVDSDYGEEYRIAKLLGYDVLLLDYDKLADEDIVSILGLYTNTDGMFDGYHVIYRGWMLKPEQYNKLYDFLKSNLMYLINSADSYKICHYLPESYKFIEPYTIKSVWFKDIDDVGHNLKAIGSEFIIKDYVKSEKTKDGISKYPSSMSLKEIKEVLLDFKEQRGKLFNEGFVLRQYIELKKYQGEVNEWRNFFINGNLITSSKNSNIVETIPSPDLTWVEDIGKNIPSNFFTIDVAEKGDGNWVVIETGDGQVSGLSPNQNVLEFYNKLSVLK